MIRSSVGEFLSAAHNRCAHRRTWTRRQVLAAGAVLAWSLAGGCRQEAPSPQQPKPAPPTTTASPESPTPTAAPPVPEERTLRRKLAQMVLVGFRGLRLDSANPIVADVRERGLGGVILFSYDAALQSPLRNVESPQQVAALTAELQAMAETPLIVAVDQEGGLVARLDERHGFPSTLSAQALGERNDPAFTYAVAEQMARTLRSVGVNHNFAPVVDLNLNPDNPIIGALGRSFSADPDVVTAQAAAFIRGHRAHGVTTTLKHFPGHGSSRDDSHLGFVDVTDAWRAVELEPYRRLIAEGLVDSIMTAHVFNARLDPDHVATLSPAILTGLLREEMGFDGVIVSDDMQMGAIAHVYGFEEAVVQSVIAGVDVIAIGNNLTYDPDVAGRVIDVLTTAVQDGRLSLERIDASIRRIDALKAKWKR
ncbi:glycoside hydrolase family 3 protein [Caldilinea sp.]|uniref:glycoside hydrolase family 3 protein n=1 Tax=Caldilinea sp. TaxID=2293560 RepID=UPI002634F80B|nr:glycoside hydrolase family 3 protein [Caldilinea sp.]